MDRADVIIIGGGMIGLALAAALDSSGQSAIVIDPADPGQRSDIAFDGRTSAVSSSSMRMLETIGVAGHLAVPGCPIRTIAVADGLEPGGLHFEPPADDSEPLGWMHENRHLRSALHDRAESGANAWLLWKSLWRAVCAAASCGAIRNMCKRMSCPPGCSSRSTRRRRTRTCCSTR